MNEELVLACPNCGAALFKCEKSYFCRGQKKHCFDIAASGYANLYPGRMSGGDDRSAVRARSEFLRAGYYKPVSDKICELLSGLGRGSVIIDAGCGEGYYTGNIALSTGAQTYGFDLSREAILSASKFAVREEISNVGFFVAGIYDLPVADSSADAIVNIFAPCAEGEFSRILKDGGLLVVALAGKNHLYGLKKAIYDTVYTNEERADMPDHLMLVSEDTVSYDIQLDSSQAIRSLFSMTPYSYRTSARDMEKLQALEYLKTEVEVKIRVYRKESKK